MSDDNMSNMLSNFNITPEMINNMANMLKNGNFGNNTSSEANNSNNQNNNSPAQNVENDNSSLNSSENMPNDYSRHDTNNDNKTSNQSNESFTQNNSSSSSNNIDFETILKIKSIMDTLNTSSDPRSNLLYSLKPYLREPRRKKLDQYVNLFKISQVSNLFKNEKGDKK